MAILLPFLATLSPLSKCTVNVSVLPGVRCVADAQGREFGDRAALLSCEPIPAFLLEFVNNGGLLPQLRRRWRRVPA